MANTQTLSNINQLRSIIKSYEPQGQEHHPQQLLGVSALILNDNLNALTDLEDKNTGILTEFYRKSNSKGFQNSLTEDNKNKIPEIKTLIAQKYPQVVETVQKENAAILRMSNAMSR